MTRTIAVVLAAALGAALSAPLPAAGNQKCTACGAVCPAGWTLCQKCKNETERAQREENRRRRLAEAEEAKFEMEKVAAQVAGTVKAIKEQINALSRAMKQAETRLGANQADAPEG